MRPASRSRLGKAGNAAGGRFPHPANSSLSGAGFPMWKAGSAWVVVGWASLVLVCLPDGTLSVARRSRAYRVAPHQAAGTRLETSVEARGGSFRCIAREIVVTPPGLARRSPFAFRTR